MTAPKRLRSYLQQKARNIAAFQDIHDRPVPIEVSEEEEIYELEKLWVQRRTELYNGRKGTLSTVVRIGETRPLFKGRYSLRSQPRQQNIRKLAVDGLHK